MVNCHRFELGYGSISSQRVLLRVSEVIFLRKLVDKRDADTVDSSVTISVSGNKYRSIDHRKQETSRVENLYYFEYICWLEIVVFRRND